MRTTALRRHAAAIAAIVVTGVALAGYTSTLIARTAGEQTRAELAESARVTSRLLSAGMGDARGLDTLARTLGSDRVRVTLIRSDGTVLADSRADAAAMENHADREEVREALAGVAGEATRSSASVGTELHYLALPPIVYSGEEIVVRVASPATTLREHLRRQQAAIAVATLVVLVLVSLVTWRADKRLVDPIQQLERAAEAYARGRFDFGLRVDYPPDLARVAASMREMASALRERITEATTRARELEAILGGMTEAVVVLDPDLRLRTLNAAALRLARLTEAETRGRTLLEVYRNTELHEFARGLLGDPAPREAAVTLEGPTHIQVHGALLNRDAGDAEPGGMVLVLSDVSRLRRLEEVRRDFVANVSHELKTPITAVKGYLDTLLGGALDDPRTARLFTETAARHADRLGAIVDDLLSLSRLEERAEVLADVEACDLGELARAVVDGHLGAAEQKRLTLTCTGGSGSRVMGNPRLLEQAIANLVDNAIKYTDPGGQVTVLVADRPPDVQVSVTDTGVGISARDLGRVFERFYRVDRERSRDLGGTGLGLSVVRHIALAHRGSVDAASTPGAGSVFTLTLPAAG